jgi:hypothetical protein
MNLYVTRSKNQLFTLNTNLTSVQKGITFSGIKIYYSLPSNILSPKNDRKGFKIEVSRYLLGNSFYSVRGFLEFSRDKRFDKLFLFVICIVLLLLIIHSIDSRDRKFDIIVLCRVISSWVLCIFWQVSCPNIVRLNSLTYEMVCMYVCT